MCNKAGQYEKSTDFLEFLNREFDKTAAGATIEELAKFAFGSLDEAVRAFEDLKKE